MRKSDETNLLIDWTGDSPDSYEKRSGWFAILRKLFLKLEEIPEAKRILMEWNVYFITKDDFPRVNIDEPK